MSESKHTWSEMEIENAGFWCKLLFRWEMMKLSISNRWWKRKNKARLIAAAPDLLKACELAHRFIEAIMEFHGEGLEVSGWHKNGVTESWDNFFDDNMDGDEQTTIEAAIAKAKG